MNEFKCYEVKIEESEKAGSRQESNCQCSATELCTATGQPPALTILYMCSGKAPVAQARGVLGSTPGDCRPFLYFRI